MSNKKTLRFKLSTLVVVALIAMLSVACKNKATASVIDFSEEAIEVASEEGVYVADNGYSAEVVGDQIKIGMKDYFGGQGDLVIAKEGKTSLKAYNSNVGYNILKDGNVRNAVQSNIFIATEAEATFEGNGNLKVVFNGYEGTLTINFAK